jgi:hypothetical protein
MTTFEYIKNKSKVVFDSDLATSKKADIRSISKYWMLIKARKSIPFMDYTLIPKNSRLLHLCSASKI